MTGGLKLGFWAVCFLFGMVLAARTCGYGEPLVIPDWADSLRAVQQEHQRERDSLHHVVDATRMVADSAKRTSETWRLRSMANRPTRPVPPVDNNVDVIPDSASVIAHLQAVNDSLWAALDASDSAYQGLDAAFTAQKQATAAALAWKDLEAARADSTEAVASLAITDLTGRLQKARRGCRVFWVISCPEVTGGYGAVLSDGQVHHGPGVQVGFKIKLGG